MECIHCGATKANSNSKKNHERLCGANPNRALLWSEKQKVAGLRPAFYDDPCYRANQAAGQQGKSPSVETRKKLSTAAKTYFSQQENRNAFCARMKLAVVEHAESYTTRNVVGRVKNIAYGSATLKGSWELLVAQTLDAEGLRWQQPTNGISYDWNGSQHLYFPDFYLPDHDLYVEVKGYARARDYAKWSVVPNLIIIKQSEISKIRGGASVSSFL